MTLFWYFFDGQCFKRRNDKKAQNAVKHMKKHQGQGGNRSVAPVSEVPDHPSMHHYELPEDRAARLARAVAAEHNAQAPVFLSLVQRAGKRIAEFQAEQLEACAA